MRENADSIRDLIARGGHVYVCGDIRIEESVRKALVDILGNGDAVKVKDLLPISPGGFLSSNAGGWLCCERSVMYKRSVTI